MNRMQIPIDLRKASKRDLARHIRDLRQENNGLKNDVLSMKINRKLFEKKLKEILPRRFQKKIFDRPEPAARAEKKDGK